MSINKPTILVGACIAFAFAQLACSQPTRQECEQRFNIRIGHEGKDVIWVPTHDRLVTAMLATAGATAADYVIDLGAGDGKIPIAAAREFGAHALGIEYDGQLVQLARCYAEAEGVQEHVEIRQADIFATDLQAATIVTMYLLPELNRKLRPSLLSLKPGTRVVSNRFKLGEWKADEMIRVEGVANEAYLWIVPARIAGLWQFEDEAATRGFTVRLRQRFQQITPKLITAGRIRNARLRGANISFDVIHSGRTRKLSGAVNDDTIRLRSDDGVIYIGQRLH